MIILIFVVIEIIVVTLVIGGIVRSTWWPLVKAYPRQPESADSVRREFQSFKFGMMNFGYSLHVTADESYMHLDPVLLMRLFGLKPVSIPWGEMTLDSRKRGKRWSLVRLRAMNVWGPSWCLMLADRVEEGDPGEPPDEADGMMERMGQK